MSQFWLSLHHLYSDYMAEGLTPDERAAGIIQALRRLTPIARRELLADFAPLAQHLPALYALSVAAVGELENPQEKKSAV